MNLLRWMLDRHEQEILELHDYLILHEGEKLLLKTVIEELGWSRYRVVTAFNSLIDDLNLVHQHAVSEEKFVYDTKYIEVKKQNQAAVLELEHYYRQNSVVWWFLIDSLLENVTSYENFAVKHNTSVSVIRSSKERATEALGKHGIKITKNNHLVGDEATLRTFFVHIMNQYHSYTEMPLNEIENAEIEEIVDAIMDIFDIENRQSLRQSLRTQVMILSVRIRNGHYLRDADLPKFVRPWQDWPEEDQEKYKAFRELFQELFELPEHIERTEVLFSILALFVSGVVRSVPRAMMTDKVGNNFSEDRKRFVSIFEQFFGTELPTEYQKQLGLAIVGPNMRQAYFESTYDRKKTSMQFLEENFPVQSHFVDCVMEDFKRQRLMWTPNADEKIANLSQEHFNAVVAIIPANMILPKIHVSLDFVYSPGLETVLHRILESQWQVNFVFNESDAPDFYISDMELDSFDASKAFVWTTFPDATTLSQFIKEAMSLSEKKFLASRHVSDWDELKESIHVEI
ncbi:helix-turn-helix domain-containing protein [Weissella ceti]|uniref:Helix-turn-helix domain-containing protein n=1 Tax=Weissella ceti TaxID=759620 RepID=A0ABT3E492_9LACO|nr:helix-turn-helix domain-containing protein [Weissella ceti]MCW0952732.1 helix-turn-helix domain-containing protein [Weissella ceti]QVK12433.1 helix-turn-helix domain-containing protein [Weissella ceti]